MNKNKIISTHLGLERIKIFTLEEIFEWVKKNPKKRILEAEGFRVKMQRAKTFSKKGIVCAKCGIKGEYFALETDKGGGIHLDLYGKNGEEEVLMTIDHIVPKALGGSNEMINLQVMCKICNELKSDEYDD